MEPRDDSGKFAPKSETVRSVRSIRATDRIWDDFGFLADTQRISRADLLEKWVDDAQEPGAVLPKSDSEGITPLELAIAVETLNKALTLKANAGGAIKVLIRDALSELTDHELGHLGQVEGQGDDK